VEVALVFAFGLLHGMGFAGVLRQLTVILAAFLCVGMWAHQSDAYRRLVVVPASIAIAATGAFWTVQRLVAY
jgi:hypothetical protein